MLARWPRALRIRTQGFWYERPTAIYANLKAFLANRVGDFGFLIGIGLVLAATGSLDYAKVFAMAPEIGGAMIDLGRSPDEFVDVLVNGHTVARGEVVVVGGNYGVRIRELMSAADRMKTLGH